MVSNIGIFGLVAAMTLPTPVLVLAVGLGIIGG